MQVEVFANTRAGGVPQIHSEVEPFRAVELLQRTNEPLGELHHLKQLFRFRAGNGIEMGVRRDHRMARGIWKQIEDNEVMIAAKDNKPFRIMASIVTNAEDTRGRLLAP